MRGHSRWADWEKMIKELIRTGDRCEMVWPCAIDFLPTPCMEKTRSSKESKELSSTSLESFRQLLHTEYGNLSHDCNSLPPQFHLISGEPDPHWLAKVKFSEISPFPGHECGSLRGRGGNPRQTKLDQMEDTWENHRNSTAFPSAHTPRCQSFLKDMLVESPVHIPNLPKAAEPTSGMKFFMAGHLQLIILWTHIKCSFNFLNFFILLQTRHLSHFLAGQIDLPNHQKHRSALGEPLEHPCFLFHPQKWCVLRFESCSDQKEVILYLA